MNKGLRNKIIKFILLILIVLSYFIYVSYKFGLSRGSIVTLLSWSFFVLCTPIPDGGFLIDFPIRLITNIKMKRTEIAVWTIAISANIYAEIAKPSIYSSTKLLTLLHKIIDTPFPYWLIILISATGTFSSLYLGDNIINQISNKNYIKKKNLTISIILISTTILLYGLLLKDLGINIAKTLN